MNADARIDHLVVVAASLEQGASWCEETLGLPAGPGGHHPFMGTHNRLLRLASVDHPRAYLEIIAIDPDAPAPARQRWFDMDDPALQQAVAQGPRLVHFVASTPDSAGALRALGRLGIDRGELLEAERPTLEGLLQWRISVRPDGQRLFYGGLPTVIEWRGRHPAEAMPQQGLALRSLQVTHPRADALRAAHAAIGLARVEIAEGPPNLAAVLATPRGEVRLESAGA